MRTSAGRFHSSAVPRVFWAPLFLHWDGRVCCLQQRINRLQHSSVMTMSQRYARAAQLTAPKVAAQYPGLSAGGYWLDAHTYFFHAEHFVEALGRVVAIPALADTRTQSVR